MVSLKMLPTEVSGWFRNEPEIPGAAVIVYFWQHHAALLVGLSGMDS